MPLGPECPSDITSQVNSPDGLQICWRLSNRELSVTHPSDSVVQIDAFRYCGGDPSCITKITALSGAKTVDTHTSVRLGPGDRLAIIPEGDPKAITVFDAQYLPIAAATALPPLPDSNPQVDQDNRDSLGSVGLYVGIVISIALAKRYLVPFISKLIRTSNAREQGRRSKARSRIAQAYRADVTTRTAGALFVGERTSPDSQLPQKIEPSATAQPETNFVYTTRLPAKVEFSQVGGPFSYIDELYPENATRSIWERLKRSAAFEKKGREEGWW